MTRRVEAPDVDRLARSMLMLYGAHDHESPTESSGTEGHTTWSKVADFASDPARAAAIHEATRRDRDRYLTSGLVPVDCRFCHATVAVKKLGPEYTAVQWNSESVRRCVVFEDLRGRGEDSNRSRACPKLADSIRHAVAEGCLDEYSSAPSPGDG